MLVKRQIKKNHPSSTKDSSISVTDFDVDTPIHIHVQERRKHALNRNPVARPGEKYPTVVPSMTREDFSIWKIPYSASRGINRTGTKEMLVRNCFSAYELGLQETVIDFLQEQNEVMKNHVDKLVTGKISLPDPYSLVDEWCNAPSHLAGTLYSDIKDYLMKHDAGKVSKSEKSLLLYDEGLLEIKSPFTYRGLSIKNYAAKTDGCLEIVDNHIQLKRTHSFFSSAVSNGGYKKEMV